MSIPTFEEIMLPTLQILSDHEVHSNAYVETQLAQHFSLTEEELLTAHPANNTRVFHNRVGWAKTFLKRAGLLNAPQVGTYQITDRGISLLNTNPLFIDRHVLEHYPEFLEFQNIHNQPNQQANQENLNNQSTPQERIEDAFSELNNQLRFDLIQKILSCSPAFFEKLVIDLLVCMGYGGSHKNAARALGRTGDQGVDGVIDQDRLGLDRVYIQAKRWSLDRSISPDLVQAFIGAITMQQATKGVFITTSRFSEAARNVVRNIPQRITLIDGDELGNLLIEFNIGVEIKFTYEVKNINSDFFEDF